jgi:hypothetical protein
MGLFFYLYCVIKNNDMKLLTYCAIFSFGITLFIACKNDGDAARDAAVQSATPAPPLDGAVAPAPGATPPATPEPAQNAAGVWHYTCPKGCEGGAGSAIACAKCGTTLAHNQAYHGNPANPTTAANPAATPPTPTPGSTTLPAPTPEPAQNAKGVWHYTCPGGCAGGAGSAIACAKCGKTLAHNQTYHQ